MKRAPVLVFRLRVIDALREAYKDGATEQELIDDLSEVRPEVNRLLEKERALKEFIASET